MAVAHLSIKTNHIYRDNVADYTGRYLVLFGGAGSGKSVYASQMFLKRILTEHDGMHKFLFIRKVGRTIKNSLFSRMVTEISNMGLSRFFKANKSDYSIECLANGNQILMMGIDDREKLKSIEGITSIWVEEATELEEEDFLQLDLRLRGICKYVKQFVLSFNPTSSKHWIVKYVEPNYLDAADRPEHYSETRILVTNKVWEFDKVTYKDDEERKLTTRVINSVYDDNRFIDEAYKDTLEFLSSVSDNYYTVYKKGRWGLTDKKGLFVGTFDSAKHVRESIEYDPNLQLHFTVDFNVEPQMSGLVIQKDFIKDGFWNGHTKYWEYRIIDEINTVAPNNQAFYLGELFVQKYNPDKIYYLYGDASGVRRLGAKDTTSLFGDLEKGLGQYRYLCEKRIPKANPRYDAIKHGSLGRKAFLSVAFSGGILPVRVLISKRCKNLLLDLEECKDDGTGRLLKKKNKNGIEERGHHLDALQYEICHEESLGYLARTK